MADCVLIHSDSHHEPVSPEVGARALLDGDAKGVLVGPDGRPIAFHGITRDEAARLIAGAQGRAA